GNRGFFDGWWMLPVVVDDEVTVDEEQRSIVRDQAKLVVVGGPDLECPAVVDGEPFGPGGDARKTRGEAARRHIQLIGVKRHHRSARTHVAQALGTARDEADLGAKRAAGTTEREAALNQALTPTPASASPARPSFGAKPGPLIRRERRLLWRHSSRRRRAPL